MTIKPSRQKRKQKVPLLHETGNRTIRRLSHMSLSSTGMVEQKIAVGCWKGVHGPLVSVDGGTAPTEPTD